MFENIYSFYSSLVQIIIKNNVIPLFSFDYVQIIWYTVYPIKQFNGWL